MAEIALQDAQIGDTALFYSGNRRKIVKIDDDSIFVDLSGRETEYPKDMYGIAICKILRG